MSKLYNEFLQLKEKLNFNDDYKICRNFLSDPETYLDWNDIEVALNGGKYYVDVISNGFRFNVEEFRYFWHDHISQNKGQLFDLIYQGHTLSITGFSQHNKKISQLVRNIEKIFSVMCDVHVYFGTSDKGSYLPHVDTPSNFIFQIDGKTNWKLYKNRSSDLFLQQEVNVEFDQSVLEVEHELILEPGDMLYIPARKFHATFPLDKRISISIPCRSLEYNIERSQNLDREYYHINFDS